MTTLSTCLWFDGNADEAVDFYLSIFPNSRRITSLDYGPDMPYKEGTRLVVDFELDGRPFIALNAGPEFKFNAAISLVVNCTTQEEIDFYWNRLVEGGSEWQCGWLVDRFGVSWQVTPVQLGELMGSPDVDAANRVTQAMMKMVKLDIAQLEAAAAG
ncbi:MAG: VOC family protein [Acidimicrobiales bacterium]|jgi:predicted 3-demethylubiquinone-9 3-methyltransferase (glyoxalase superfamily)